MNVRNKSKSVRLVSKDEITIDDITNESNDLANVGDIHPQLIPTLNDSLEYKGFVFLLDRENNEKHSVEYCTKLVLDLGTNPLVEKINIMINCSGGSVTDFLGLYDMIHIVKKLFNKNVDTCVYGLAASGAALVLQAGDTRMATKNACIMLHEVSGGVSGTSSDMDEEYEQMQVFEKVVFKIWADSMGITIKELKEILKKKDVYYHAKQAKKVGLIDQIVK